MTIPKGATHIDSAGVYYHERGDGQYLYWAGIMGKWCPSPEANRGEIDLFLLKNDVDCGPAHLSVKPEEDEAWAELERSKVFERRMYGPPDVDFKHSDPVNHPDHYTQGGIECIDAIEAALTPEEFRGYCKGNALKYVWRERRKGGDESIAKAQWYLNRL